MYSAIAVANKIAETSAELVPRDVGEIMRESSLQWLADAPLFIDSDQISRFYDADQGSVSIDGVDVKQIAREDHTRQVGVVLQEPFLFRGTIFENLLYGRPEAKAESAKLQ